ncbi:T9SS type A sorting domain-containing protein [Crocinitomix catalasitica]|nr:T9SS type A sorting domain-containing protein [Crocinitomix catalasitica]
MKTISYFLLTLIILLFSHSAISQHETDPAWSDNIELPTPPGSESVRGFLYSNMAVFSNNKRLVFLNNQEGIGGIWHTHSYDGINWTNPQMFGPDSLVIGLNSPKAIRDNDDTLHLIWTSQDPIALYYTKMDSALNIIIDSVRISDIPDYNIFRDMYISTDLNGRVHVMWNEGITGTSDKPESYYSQTTDGGNTWSPKTLLSINDDISSSFPRGQFNACNGDTLAIMWRDSSLIFSPADNWNLQMAVSVDGGLNWDPAFEVNPQIAMQGDPDLVIDPYGRFHLFYHQASPTDPYWGMRLVYGYSDDLGSTWTESTFTDTISYAERSYLAEGSRYDIENDVLWTFWKEEDIAGLQGGDMMAAYSSDRGENWSEPQYVTDRNDTTIGFKSVDLMPGGGIAVNYELPNYPDSGKFRVYYKERGPVIVTQIFETTQDQEQTVLLYPNPFNSMINIRMDTDSDFQLYDGTGRLILNGHIEMEDSIDLSDYSSGNYILRIGNVGHQIIKL